MEETIYFWGKDYIPMEIEIQISVIVTESKEMTTMPWVLDI